MLEFNRVSWAGCIMQRRASLRYDAHTNHAGMLSVSPFRRLGWPTLEIDLFF